MTQTMGKKQRWSQGLPEEILQLIAQRLYISDYIVFRQVCPSWRAAVALGIATRYCSPSPHQPPWILLLDSYRDSLQAFYIDHQHSFVRSPTSFRSETISASYLRFCVGSVESWLIVTVRKRCRRKNFFLNPLSRARIKLPSGRFSLMKAVTSSPPSPKRNCFVAALCSRNRLGICRATDKSWTLVQTIDEFRSKDLEIFDQKLYVVGLKDHKYTVLEYALLSEDDNVTRPKYICSIFSIDIPYLALGADERQCSCLVRDSTSMELFLVLCTSTIRRGVRVYKMERNSSDGKPSFEEVTDLGDRILFLSLRSKKVINCKTLGKNCIYFAFKLIEGFWVYSLTDRSIKRVHLPKDYPFRRCGSTLWFTPHPW